MSNQGHSKTEIARTLGKNKFVVGGEINRNKDAIRGRYLPDTAQREVDKRKASKPKAIRFTLAMKEQVGGMEFDTAEGAFRQGVLLIIDDRASAMDSIRNLNRRTSTQVKLATIEALEEWRPCLHTASAEYGREFAAQEGIAASIGIDSVIAKP